MGEQIQGPNRCVQFSLDGDERYCLTLATRLQPGCRRVEDAACRGVLACSGHLLSLVGRSRKRGEVADTLPLSIWTLCVCLTWSLHGCRPSPWSSSQQSPNPILHPGVRFSLEVVSHRPLLLEANADQLVPVPVDETWSRRSVRKLVV